MNDEWCQMAFSRLAHANRSDPTHVNSCYAFYLELQQEGRTVVQCMIKFNMFQFSHNYSDRKMKLVVLILLSEFGIWTR